MRSAKHVSIKQLKKQPRLGMASIFDDFANQMKDIQSSGAIYKVSKQIDEFAASLRGVGPTLTSINDLIGANISEAAAMSAGVGRATAYLNEFTTKTAESVKNLTFLIESQKDLQQEFSMSSAGAFDFSKRLRAINVDIGDAKLFKYAGGLGQITGGFISSAKANKGMVEQLVKTQAFLQNNLGLSEDTAQSFELYAAGMGQSSEDALLKINEMSTALSDFTGIDAVQQQSQIIQDIVSMGEDLQLQYGRVGNNLEVATMKARLLGTTMESLHGTGESLLNIESSIGTEMEYQQLTGRRLLDNQGKSLTNEYRMATITGNSTKQAELMNQFIAKEGDTLEKNLFARQKAAQLMGTDEASLAKMIQKRKLLVRLGAEEIMNMGADDAKGAIAKLRKDAKTEDEIKTIDELLKASDTRTPAERSADSLDSIKRDIAFIGQGGTVKKTYDEAGNVIGRERTSSGPGGEKFMEELTSSVNASMKFAQKASDTFTDPNFIKGIGTLGVVSDRIAESVTPLKQLGEVLPGILSDGIGALTGAITKLTSVVKQPYTTIAAETQLATGGYISGAGTGTSDSIPARLSDGEYVINAAATRRNKPLLDKINSGGSTGYAAGGPVTSYARMEGLLQSILVTLRGSNVMGATEMNRGKRI